MKLLITKYALPLGCLAMVCAEETTTVVSSVTKASAEITSSSISKTRSFHGDEAKVKGLNTIGARKSKIKSSSTEVVEVEAIGYGRDHATALSEACTQAVSQVCGAQVTKAIVTMGNRSGQIGATVYDGILISYRVLQDARTSDGIYNVKIKAQVTPPPADMFSEKLALVLPSSQSLKMELSSGNLKSDTVEALSSSVEQILKDTVTNDDRFVLLERDSTLARHERDFASSSHASRLEKGKSGNMKAADFIIDVALISGTEKMNVKEFKTAKRSKYTLNLDVQIELRLVDVVTGGIASRETVAIKRSATSWREEKCLQSVMDGVNTDCAAAFSEKLDALLSKVK